MKPRHDQSTLLLYQLRGDLLLKVAMIFMIQASTVARIAKLNGAPTQTDATKPDLKLFLDPAGTCHVGHPAGETNLLERLQSLSGTHPSPRIAVYVDEHHGVGRGDQLVAPLLLIRQTVPTAHATLATYEH